MQLARYGLLVLLLGCAADETAPQEGACLSPNRLVDDRCVEPGVQDDGCPAGAFALSDGTCRAAGVPAELCAEGFVHDGDANCEPTLPPEVCPAGQIALPGDMACRPVMSCGSGTWGDIPVEPNSVYVDSAYTGADSDGSTTKPWTTLAQAITAAPAGALIAVAAGRYAEDVMVQKHVRIWGVCPERVELAGSLAALGAIDFRAGASTSELHGVALTSMTIGIVLSGVEEVLLDRVWVHDAYDRGVNVQGNLGPTSVTLRDSLIEKNHNVGVYLNGANVTLERVIIRGTLPRPSDGGAGRGLGIEGMTTALVQSSIVEGNHELGVNVLGANATFEGTIVRDTRPRPSDQHGGRGINIQDDIGLRPNVNLRSSLIERNHDVGIAASGGNTTLEGVTVRDTQPRAYDQFYSAGIMLQPHPQMGGRATGLVRSSLVHRNYVVGISAEAADLTLEGVLVRGQLPQPGYELHGWGMTIHSDIDDLTPSIALVRGSLVEQNHVMGLAVTGSSVAVEALLVRNTLPNLSNGQHGDGILVQPSIEGAASDVSVTSSRVEQNSRTGLVNAGTHVPVGTSALLCNLFDLEGEELNGSPFSFDNLGGNACGCPQPSAECVVKTIGVSPPEPPPPPDDL
jgi:uncharacterized protein DUF1565